MVSTVMLLIYFIVGLIIMGCKITKDDLRVCAYIYMEWMFMMNDDVMTWKF